MSSKTKSKIAGLLKNRFNVELMDYQTAHLQLDCDSSFQLKLVENIFLSINALGPTQFPFALIVTCEKCNATFVPNRFQEYLEQRLSAKFIYQNGHLTNKQARFLRLAANLSPSAVAKGIGSNLGDYKKIESSKNDCVISDDMDVQIKSFYSKFNGIIASNFSI